MLSKRGMTTSIRSMSEAGALLWVHSDLISYDGVTAGASDAGPHWLRTPVAAACCTCDRAAGSARACCMLLAAA